MKRRLPVLAAVFTTVVLLAAVPAAGHDLTLTDALVVLKLDGTYQVDLTCDLDALALGRSSQSDSAELAAELAALSPEELEAKVDDLETYFERRVRVVFDDEAVRPVVSFPDRGTAIAEGEPTPTFLGLTARLEGRLPEGARTFSLRLSRSFPPAHLTVLHQGQAAWRELVEKGTPSSPYPLTGEAPEPDRGEVAGRYLVLGFWHIVPEGLDHILFVLGLFLLSVRLGPLLWQVSAFTAAHTTSLALATYGVVDLSPRVVEPLIALSIAYVAAENLFTEELRPWRVWLVFAFGLLHGLGFAGVLGELGLPRGELATALLSFNVGVELGQLAVILAALLVLGAWRKRAFYRRRVVVPLSLLIAFVGVYWAFERVFMVA